MNMKVINVLQGTPEWLDWRKQGLSATTAAIILELSPYKSPWRLWAEMLGKVEEDDLSKNPLVKHGKRNEDRLRKKIEADEFSILLPICCEHTKNPLYRASLDGLDDNDIPWELKWPSNKVWHEVNELGVKSEAYLLYYPQVQHQLLVTGAREGRLVFGNDLTGEVKYVKFIIKRDEAMINEIMLRGLNFWNMILKKTPPAKDITKDYYEPNESEVESWIELAKQASSIQQMIDPLLNEKEKLEKKINSLQAKLEPIKKSASVLMGDYKEANSNGLFIRSSVRKGSIDYRQALDQLQGQVNSETLERFRRESSKVTTLSINHDELQQSM
jgi:putative phage-type endonuclease